MRQSGGLSLAADESGGNTMILSSPVAGTKKKEEESNPSEWKRLWIYP